MVETMITPQLKSHRRALLERAADTIDGDRDKEYGGPESSFDRIAKVWQALVDYPFTATEVAMLMAGLKLARLASTDQTHEDSWVDVAGYAGCGYEIIKLRAERRESS
jgi:hypothetical protein